MNPRRALLLVVLVTGAAAIVTGVGWQLRLSGRPAGHDAGPGAPASAPSRAEVSAVAVLRAWDERRAAAWAAGDPVALRRLYAAGSRTGAADRRMLAAYAGRGLVVTGMHTQVLAAQVRSADPDLLVLEVTDRLSGGQVDVGGARLVLPRDTASRHLVELVRERGRWVVSEVLAGVPTESG